MKITNREAEIMYLMSYGGNQKTLAHQLGISQSTLTRHLQNLREKTNSENLVEIYRKISEQSITLKQKGGIIENS